MEKKCIFSKQILSLYAYFPRIATLISYEGILKARQDHKTTKSVCLLRKRKSKLVTCD